MEGIRNRTAAKPGENLFKNFLPLGRTWTFIFLFLVFSSNVYSQISSTASGNWSNATTWGGCPIPTATDDVIITAGTTVTVDLPSGETALSQMKPYISASAGITYSIIKEYTNIDVGVSAFHVNKPKQTFLQDDRQYLPIRYVAHANLETYLSEQAVLNTNGIYQYQSGASYFSIGGALGYILPQYDRDIIVNAGLWYWSNNAVIPYVGLVYGNFQFGLTYDFTISKLNEAARRSNTFELCFILRGGSTKNNGVIPSPWK